MTKLPTAMQSIDHQQVTAESNNVAYDVWTWVPPTYSDLENPIPLVLLLDGDMFMGAAVDTVNLLSSMSEAQPAIVVGVTTAPPGVHGVQRTIDYSAEVPTPEMLKAPSGTEFSFWDMYIDMFKGLGMNFEEGFGGTDQFLSFLTDQILPDLESRYNIDNEQLAIAGHSSGGDFAIDTLLRKNTPFNKFIVGSFGTDVLEATLAEREAMFAETKALKAQLVFCGYGGAEKDDPHLGEYIERGIALIKRLEQADSDLTVTLRGFEKETHGSVFPHIFSSGYRELFGTGVSFVEALS